MWRPQGHTPGMLQERGWTEPCGPQTGRDTRVHRLSRQVTAPAHMQAKGSRVHGLVQAASTCPSWHTARLRIQPSSPQKCTTPGLLARGLSGSHAHGPGLDSVPTQ